MTQALQTYDAPGPEAWWTDFFINDHVRFQMALAEESHDSDVETDLFTGSPASRQATTCSMFPAGRAGTPSGWRSSALTWPASTLALA